jgi:hypothetical protein
MSRPENYETALTLLRAGKPTEMRKLFPDTPEIFNLIDDLNETVDDLNDEVSGLEDKISRLEDDCATT